jgi:uncharacterized PurR-regulated membrane protein YhhQ (DUF165 family)
MRITKFEHGPMPVPARERVSRAYGLDEGAPAWPPKTRAYGGEVDTLLLRLKTYGRIAGRLALPVLLLFTLLQAVYLFADAPLPQAWLPSVAQGQLLTLSDLVLPGCWLVIHLTNRRFGPAYAFGNLLAGLVLALLVALLDPWGVRASLPDLASLSTRAVSAFVLVFAVANFVGIVFFDAARGPRWWTAPIAGSLAAAFVFSGLYYPLAFGRLGFEALAHFALFLGVSAGLMGPYFLLRPAMKPLDGMNGY